MSLTDFIARFSQIGKKKFIVMQFPTVIKVISAYDNVIVKMFAVDMRGDDCFTVAEAFDKLHPNLVDLLRRYILSGHKRLHKMIKANAARRMVAQLSKEKDGSRSAEEAEGIAQRMASGCAGSD